MKIDFLLLDKINNRYIDEVWNLLCIGDHEFVPPLSSRESTTQSLLSGESSSSFPHSYFEKLKEQKIILAMHSDKVVGFMSYIEPYSCSVVDNVVYISTIIVDKEYRGHSITEKMYDRIFREYPQEHIVTRTWSTNYAHIHILEKFGFHILKVVKDDRGEGIDTIYFSKNK